VQPFFLFAYVEEVIVRVLASWVVWIHVELLFRVERLLNVPEHVSGYGPENL